MRLLASAALTLSALPALTARAQDDDLVAAMERRTGELARDAAPAIVSVTAITRPVHEPRTLFPGLVLTPPPRGPERLEATGFLVSAEGVVATTSELAHENPRFVVRFVDGVEREAWLLGADEAFRVAFLRVDPPANAKALSTTAPLDAGNRRLGWLVTPTASGGDADALLTTVRTATCAESTYDRFLATSIHLDAGAAGAPLLARDGRLLGMAVGAVATFGAPGGASHAGVAGGGPRCRTTLFVRGDDVLSAAADILREGRVRRARVGVLLDDDTNRVDQLLPGGPAELAGLRDGDEITAIAGAPVTDAAAITRTLLRRKPGDVVPVDVRRGAETQRFRVTLDDVDLPPVPTVSPFPGAVLGMTWSIDGSGAPGGQTVSVQSLDEGCGLGLAGALVGDRVLSVDGLDVRRFIVRHRVRPSPVAPAAVVVLRDGTEMKLTLRR